MNATNRAGNDALMHACISDSLLNTNNEKISGIKCVKLLLQAGAHVNTTDRLGFTALSELIYFHHFIGETKHYINKLQLLLAAGETIDGSGANERDKNILCNLLETDIYFPKLCLKHVCRKAIAKHLTQFSPINLFVRVPQLGLPSLLVSYLLYGTSLSTRTEYKDVLMQC